MFIFMFLTQCQRSSVNGAEISIDEVYEIINDSARVNNYVVLDTRPRMDYVRGHLVSSIWLSLDSVESKIGILSDEPRPFIIYDSGTQKSAATDILLKNGITNFYVMSGGFSKWRAKGYPAAIQLVRNTSNVVRIQKKYISAEQASELMSSQTNAVLIDARTFPAYEEVHIIGALSIPYVPINEFVVNIEDHNFSRNSALIICCEKGSDIGEKACEVLLRNDFTQVYLLDGGIEEWISKDLPIASGV